MTLAPWFVSGIFVIVSLAVVLGAKRYWVKAIGLLFGIIFLQDFLQKLIRDTPSLIVTLLVAAAAVALFIVRARRKAKKKRDDDDDRRNGGTVINFN